MAKRKSSSDNDSNDRPRSSKKSNNSLNHSYIQTANMMSKTKLFQNGLNLNMNAAMQVKEENISVSESEDTPQKSKTKSKMKNQGNKTITNSDSENERESTIALLLNETKNIVLKNKSNKSRKQKSGKARDNFSPKILPNVKIEHEEQDYADGNDIENVSFNSNQKLSNGPSSNPSSIYQEDDDEMMTSVENRINLIQDIRIVPVKDKLPQQQLNELYPNLVMMEIASKLKVKESNEVYLLRTPKSVEPQNLLNLCISLEGTSKVKIDGKKFIIRPTVKIPDPTLVLGNKSEVLNFKKNLVMEKYVKAINLPNVPTVEKASVPPPNNLKNRHPLFGSNFEDKIHLDEAVEKRLDAAILNSLKSSKSKKNKKTDKHKVSVGHSTLLPDVSEIDNFNLNISSISPQKKSKKKKTVESNTIGNDDFSFIADLFKTDDTEKKTKRPDTSKQNDENTISISFEKHDNNLSSERKIKKRKIKEEIMDSIDLSSEKHDPDLSSERKTKKPKIKEEIMEGVDVTFEKHNKDISSERKTKKRKVKEEIMDTSPNKKKKIN